MSHPLLDSQAFKNNSSRKEPLYDSLFYQPNSQPISPFLQYRAWERIQSLKKLSDSFCFFQDYSLDKYVLKEDHENDQAARVSRRDREEKKEDESDGVKKEPSQKSFALFFGENETGSPNLVPFTKALLRQEIIQSEEERQAMELFQMQLGPMQSSFSFEECNLSQKNQEGLLGLSQATNMPSAPLNNFKESEKRTQCPPANKKTNQRFIFGEISHKINLLPKPKEEEISLSAQDRLFGSEMPLLRVRNSFELSLRNNEDDFDCYSVLPGFSPSFKKPQRTLDQSGGDSVIEDSLKRNLFGSLTMAQRNQENQKATKRGAKKNDFPVSRRDQMTHSPIFSRTRPMSAFNEKNPSENPCSPTREVKNSPFSSRKYPRISISKDKDATDINYHMRLFESSNKNKSRFGPIPETTPDKREVGRRFKFGQWPKDDKKVASSSLLELEEK